MSKPPKTNFMALIAGEVAPAALPPIEEAPPAPPPATDLHQVVTLPRQERKRYVAPNPAGTLKTRARRLSVYLEAPVYDCLRDIAYEERTKLHPLILEAIDLLLKKRGSRSIKELTRNVVT